MISDINELYDKEKEEALISRLLSLVGKEQFRPKLDQIKLLLQDDIEFIEKNVKKVIVVAGTNGKGETCHNLRAILQHNGHTTSLWTSPHVLTVCERMVINDLPISYDDFSDLLDKYSSVAIKEELSFYEFLFYIFIKQVLQDYPDFLILEVGLGGTFDAVNIFSCPLTCICSISRDHTKILGNDLSGILKEKYGVSRRGEVLLSGVEQKFLQEKLVIWSERDGVELKRVELVDDYVVQNKNMAIALAEELGIDTLGSKYKWPITKGRREKVTILSRNFIFIGAHNLDGHRKMLKMLEQSQKMKKTDDVLFLSFSTGREDQIESIISLYDNCYPCLFGQKYLTEFQGERSLRLGYLEESNNNFSLISDWKIVFDDSFKNKNIYIVGSYFFIADFQSFLLASSEPNNS